MGNITEEIERIEDAKSAIDIAIIQSGGPAGEEDDLIDTYAERVRAIPSAVLSNLNVDKTGGAGSYIESIEQEDGKIVTTTGGTVSTSKSGLAPQIVTTNAATIAAQTSELVLTSNGSTTVWKKLPANAFANSNSWRAIQVNGTQIAGTGTGTFAANFISGTGITVAGTEGSSSKANGITITNAGVRSTTVSGNYLRVNTGGTTTDLTIPFATTANGAKSLTPYRDLIKITTDDDTNTDNPLTWSTVGTSIHMYSVHNSLYSQPSQYGLLLSLAYDQDIHQIWATQSTGNLYHRGGNSAGWANSGSWITILDSANSSVSGDGGNTWGSSITVKINNVSKTLTIPANPNTDEKVAYTANASNVAHPILFANNSTSTGNPTTGAVYYESNATSGAGLTYNPYSNLLNIPNGKLQINTTVKDHGATSDQCLYIYAPTPSSGTTITTKNSPGIGFKVEGNNWGSIVFNQGVFEFAKNDFVSYHNIRANILMSTVATGTAPLRINSTTLVSNLNADMLDNLHASDFYKKTDTIDADTLGGHPAEDFFLNTDLLEGFSIEDLTVEATVRVSRSYYYNTSGVGTQTVYNTSGNGLTNPASNSLIKPTQIGLKGPIIRVISVTKTGNASTYTANIGEQYITVNFSGTSVANTGDSFEFKLLLPAFNNS